MIPKLAKPYFVKMTDEQWNSLTLDQQWLIILERQADQNLMAKKPITEKIQ
ncbi:MAG: hypothetical protein WBQ89_22640 [Candidatus Acidiferrum sp.]